MEKELDLTSEEKSTQFTFIEEILLLKKRMKRERFITHSAYLVIIAIILSLWKCDGDKKENLLMSANHKADSLQKIVNDYQSHKPIISSQKSFDSDGKSGTYGFIEWVSKDAFGKDNIFIEDVIKKIPYKVEVPIPCPEIPECPELKDSCVMDTIKAELWENSSSDSAKRLHVFEGFRLIPYSNSSYQLNICKKEFPKPEPYVYSYTKTFVDQSLIKRAKTKHWVATGGRFLAMLAYNRLYHSDSQFAITVNDVGPYEDANPLRNSNIADKNIAKWKSAGEVGIWLLHGGSEVLDYSAQNDYSNAYSSEQMSATFYIYF